MLSLTHQYETQQRSNWESRIDVIETMVELSQFHAIAHPTVIVPQEIDQIVTRWIGTQSAPVRPFGRGLNFMLGTELDTFPIPADLNFEELGYPPNFSRLIRTHPDQALELILMAGPHPELNIGANFRAFFHALKQNDKTFSDGQEEVARIIKENKLHSRLDDAMVAYALSEIKEELLKVAAQRRVHPSQVIDKLGGTAENFRSLLEGLPSRHVVKELSLMQHMQPHKKWKPNDLSDLTALGVAIPYCDVVVTEKFWTDSVRRRGLDKRYATIVSDNLQDLPQILVDIT
ncbi:hypothetical protein GS502_13565 [Rhodococcus hoagii]|nr:hypothetical protein [Prescottella equi]